MRRATTVFVLAGCAFALSSAPAIAQSAFVTIDSRAPALEKGDSGTYTAALGFTNLTGKPIALTAKPAKPEPGCILALDPAQLPAAEHTDVTVKIPAGCTVAKNGISFTVSSAAPATSVTVTAAPKPESTPKPDWGQLWAFPIALGACLIAAGVFFLWWRARRTVKITAPLKSLPATWSFGDSWVTNVTAIGGLLAGLFGTSDVVRALIGKDADSSVALATVGAAAALFFVGAAPIVLLTTKTKKEDFTTVGGLLAASAVTLAGAYGELWVIWKSGSKLDLGGWEDRIWVLALVLGVLLFFYAVRSVRAELDLGIKKPDKPPVPDAVVAAKMIVEALKAHENVDQKALDDALVKITPEYEKIGTSPPDDYLQRPRTALL